MIKEELSCKNIPVCGLTGVEVVFLRWKTGDSSLPVSDTKPDGI